MFQRRHPVDWSVLLSALFDVDGHAGHAEHLRQVDHDETGQGLSRKAGIRAYLGSVFCSSRSGSDWLCSMRFYSGCGVDLVRT